MIIIYDTTILHRRCQPTGRCVQCSLSVDTMMRMSFSSRPPHFNCAIYPLYPLPIHPQKLLPGGYIAKQLWKLSYSYKQKQTGSCQENSCASNQFRNRRRERWRSVANFRDYISSCSKSKRNFRFSAGKTRRLYFFRASDVSATSGGFRER